MLQLDVSKIYNMPNKDPDKYNDELGKAHCILWSSKNKLGELGHSKYNRLSTTINGIEFIFTPDSITNSYYKNKTVSSFDDEVQQLIEEYKRKENTIGSSIIFPIRIDGQSIIWTMNRARGLSKKVHDRFDYSLECIKRYYDKNEDNPLLKAVEKSSKFFDTFDSFKEYVDFFFLNDLVDENYNVISFTDTIDFDCAIPKTKESYIKYLKNTMTFVKKRDLRIKDWCDRIV